MRNTIFSTLFLLLAGTAFGQSQAKTFTDYEYTFKINGATDTVYLANYFGKQLYYADTAYKKANGDVVFKGHDKKEIKAGKFAVVFPGKTYFEIIINEPSFTMIGDTANLVEGMEVQGSKENKAFYDYIKFINTQKKKIAPLTAEFREEKTKEKRKDELKTEIALIDSSVKAYQKNLGQQNDLLVGQIINITVDLVIPDPPQKADGSIDSTFQYYYYRNHFFDNVNFDNDAIVRCPSYHNKIEEFFTKVVLQNPDTINKVSDVLFSKFDPKSDVFKYTVNFVFNHFNKSKIVGMDGVFAHIGEKYYMTGKAHWADSATVAKISERVNAISPTLIGKKAPPLVLYDTTQQRKISLYGLDAEVTIIAIWSHTCGHCKKVMPKLKQIYDKYKDKGVEIYGVGNELENEGWIKFCREHDFNWINVSDKPEDPNAFRTVYDVSATPKFYMLDADKKIFVKGIGVTQIEQVLKQKLKITDDPTWVIDPEEAKELDNEEDKTTH